MKQGRRYSAKQTRKSLETLRAWTQRARHEDRQAHGWLNTGAKHTFRLTARVQCHFLRA
jgi:hypothetical protein